MGPKFRRLAHFLGVLFGLWKDHAAKYTSFSLCTSAVCAYHVTLLLSVTSQSPKLSRHKRRLDGIPRAHQPHVRPNQVQGRQTGDLSRVMSEWI